MKESLQIRLWNLNFTSNAPVAPRRLSCPISANQREAKRSADVKKKKKNIEKHVQRVMTSLLMSSPPISISYRHFRCRSIFKVQRRSCKLSFRFPPRRQSVPESLFAGYPGTGNLSLSTDCCWMRIPLWCDPNMENDVGTYPPPPTQAPTTGQVTYNDDRKGSPRFLINLHYFSTELVCTQLAKT